MAKSPDAFRTISEVASWLDTPAHVLRFWESRFNQVKPVKRAGGRRYYRPNDMLLLGGIRRLLHDDGITIKGAQKILREKGVKYVSSLSIEELDYKEEKLSSIRTKTPIKEIVSEDENAAEIADISDESTKSDSTPAIAAEALVKAPPTVAEPTESASFSSRATQRLDEAPQSFASDSSQFNVGDSDQTIDNRIVALYQRLKTLRDKVHHDISLG